MIDPYWKFIFGLQHNAQKFFEGQLDYYYIKHEWMSLHCDVFLVRDFTNNALLYDSVDRLVVRLSQQNFII